jgi:small conductance mechanosensitive channel
MSELLERLDQVFSARAFAQALVHDWLPSAAKAAFVLAGYYLLWRLLDRGAQAVARRLELDKTAHAFLASVLRYAVFTIGIVSALTQVGIDTGALLASLGVAGLTVGFAAKDAMSNVISGIFIFWDRPFVVDDLIEVGDAYGRVAEITLRSTRVVTTDGRMLAIPNAQVINSVVASYTNFPNLRLDIDVTVAVDEDLEHARRVLLTVVADDPAFMREPSPRVVVKALNDYNVALQLQAWIHDERSHITQRFALRERCFEAFRGANVDMPYETLSLNVATETAAS